MHAVCSILIRSWSGSRPADRTTSGGDHAGDAASAIAFARHHPVWRSMEVSMSLKSKAVWACIQLNILALCLSAGGTCYRMSAPEACASPAGTRGRSGLRRCRQRAIRSLGAPSEVCGRVCTARRHGTRESMELSISCLHNCRPERALTAVTDPT